MLTLKQQLALTGRLERGWRRAIRPLERTRPSKTYKPRRTLRTLPHKAIRQPTLAMRRLRIREQMRKEA